MTQGNRTPLKQQHRAGQTPSAPKTIRPDYADMVEEDRIDWERKQKGKKVIEATEEPDDLLTEELVVELVVNPPKAKKQHKKKHRELIYDDERDQTIVKRKRRRQSEHFHAQLDDFE